mmetsp:Transcript_25165/g.46922  ORF Transcript_25165/g.46922 Transcript_25165/m.46922 type:complete len:223 (-) Transcript_25165:56-724(-)
MTIAKTTTMTVATTSNPLLPSYCHHGQEHYVLPLRDEEGPSPSPSSESFLKKIGIPGMHKTSSISPLQQKRKQLKRRVRFQPLVRKRRFVKEGDDEDDTENFNHVHPRELWYTRNEYKAMQTRERKLSQMFSSSAKISDELMATFHGVVCLEIRRLRRDRVEAAIIDVLMEQEACWDGYRGSELESVHHIASVYTESSRVAARLARDRAKNLESEIMLLNRR